MSTWATPYIERLRAGETVSFRPRGHSMAPLIRSGQRCLVAPAQRGSVDCGDIVLCTVRGRDYLHLVSAIRGDQYQISNNRGHVNGWIGQTAIHGRLVAKD